MTEQNDEQLQKLIKRTLQRSSEELQSDLWPRMLRKLDERQAAVPWFDWALLAAVVLCLCLVPRAIPVFLYHL